MRSSGGVIVHSHEWNVPERAKESCDAQIGSTFLPLKSARLPLGGPNRMRKFPGKQGLLYDPAREPTLRYTENPCTSEDRDNRNHLNRKLRVALRDKVPK